MTRRLLAVLHARNLEFLRDRATLGWNVLLPVVLVIAMGLIFGGAERPLFKVAVLHAGDTIDVARHPFLRTHYVEFFTARSEADAIKKVSRHQIDLLLDVREVPPRYWVNTDSPKGYIVEKLLLESDPGGAHREAVTGQAVRYIDWLLPGILGMNMMFSCLFGVGWVVVRYRKSGFLKRLRATPLRAIEFISAQVLSRLILIMLVTVFVFAALQLVLHFRMEGNPLLIFVVALLGAISLIAIGLFVAARFTSEELASRYFSIAERQLFRRHVLWTRIVSERRTDTPDGPMDLVEYVRDYREELVLKPNRGYGGTGVVLGAALSQSEWETLLGEALAAQDDPHKNWVVQAATSLPVHLFPVLDEQGRTHEEPFYTVMGFAPTDHGLGIIARVSQKQVVNVAQRGGLAAVLVGYRPEDLKSSTRSPVQADLAMQELRALVQRLRDLDGVIHLLEWDEETYRPRDAAENRASRNSCTFSDGWSLRRSSRTNRPSSAMPTAIAAHTLGRPKPCSPPSMMP